MDEKYASAPKTFDFSKNLSGKELQLANSHLGIEEFFLIK